MHDDIYRHSVWIDGFGVLPFGAVTVETGGGTGNQTLKHYILFTI